MDKLTHIINEILNEGYTVEQVKGSLDQFKGEKITVLAGRRIKSTVQAIYGGIKQIGLKNILYKMEKLEKKINVVGAETEALVKAKEQYRGYDEAEKVFDSRIEEEKARMQDLQKQEAELRARLIKKEKGSVSEPKPEVVVETPRPEPVMPIPEPVKPVPEPIKTPPVPEQPEPVVAVDSQANFSIDEIFSELSRNMQELGTLLANVKNEVEHQRRIAANEAKEKEKLQKELEETKALGQTKTELDQQKVDLNNREQNLVERENSVVAREQALLNREKEFFTKISDFSNMVKSVNENFKTESKTDDNAKEFVRR